MAIVGSGLSGLRLAVDLAAAAPRAEILLVEAGPLSRLEHEGRDRREHRGDGRVRLWGDTGTPLWGPSGGVKPRVGGRSLCWHGQLVPLEDYALAGWPPVWQERLPRLCAGIVSELASLVEPPAPAPGPWSAAGLLPVPQAARLEVDGEGVVRSWSAYSPLEAALDLANLTLIANSPITQVRRADGRWQLLRRDGPPLEVDLCVLSAGAVANVAILAQSLQVELRVPLCDHLCAGAVRGWTNPFPPPARPRGSATLLGYVRDEGLGANIFFQELAEAAGDVRLIDLWVLAEQSPGEASRLTCAPGADGAARVSIEPRLSHEDRERLSAARRRGMQLVDSILGSAAEISECADEGVAIDAALTAPQSWFGYERPLGSVDHEACSHSFGDLCDSDLAVPGLPGVYLNGPGVFPRAGAANPGLTILALSSWLAGALATRLT